MISLAIILIKLMFQDRGNLGNTERPTATDNVCCDDHKDDGSGISHNDDVGYDEYDANDANDANDNEDDTGKVWSSSPPPLLPGS